MILYQIITTFLVTLIARSTKMYILNDKEWINKYFFKLTKMTIVRGFILLVLIHIFANKGFIK